MVVGFVESLPGVMVTRKIIGEGRGGETGGRDEQEGDISGGAVSARVMPW